VTDSAVSHGTMNSRTVIVTGGAGAIGRAVAANLIAQGARVALIDIDQNALEATCSKLGGLALPFVADLSDPDAVVAAAAKVVNALGGVDTLVNNAGVLSNNKIAETDIAEWRRVHAINVESGLLFCKAVLPGMRERRWGRIINISSYAAKSGGLTAGTAYSVSKSAMIGLTFAVARETAGEGITANAIAPAYVMSRMISEQLTDQQRAAQLAEIPVGRFCEPEEVAHTVSFLASPLAGFITGEVIDMNGGLHFD
jgi:3-oxoacyl-[acyl-carrier protein] reductase